MPIKYSDVIIIKNIQEETIFTTISRYFSLGVYETIINDNDTIIVTFDNETVCDTKDEYIDKKYTFGDLNYDTSFPIYFKTNKKEMYFYRTPIVNNGILKLDLKPIFKNCENYELENVQPSDYNLIYENCKKEVKFAIVRIKSNQEKPRYKIAYDSNDFDRTDIIYLINSIFKHKFS